MTSERNSIGIEIDNTFIDIISKQIVEIPSFSNEYIRRRINKHIEFIEEREKNNKPLKYYNEYHQFPVMTRQEVNLKLNYLKMVNSIGYLNYMVYYESKPVVEQDSKQMLLF